MQSREETVKNLLTRNVEEIIERQHLEQLLKSGKKLRVKFGIDPTGEKIHIGRAVALWKLREFQNLGHKIILIIGDFTAQIGDPSDKLEKRPFLAPVQIKENLKNYMPQIGKILDLKKVEVRHNSEWLQKLNFGDVFHLAELFTFQQILERRNFRERFEKYREISYHEGMYALMQGYDSVAVKADVELGGADQLFNLLAGRKIQEHYGQKPQDILMTKMLLGTDGRKMSTSWGNVINIDDSPDEQFGKVMSMHDDQILNYLELATDEPLDVTIKYRGLISQGGTDVRDVKWHLAFDIVMRYHGEAEARDAAEKWSGVFSKQEAPANLPKLKLETKNPSALELVLASGAAKSRSEARRLIEQGGFEISGAVKKNASEVLYLRGGEAVRIGKKKFFRISV